VCNLLQAGTLAATRLHGNVYGWQVADAFCRVQSILHQLADGCVQALARLQEEEGPQLSCQRQALLRADGLQGSLAHVVKPSDVLVVSKELRWALLL
jgi:hypothetical protein